MTIDSTRGFAELEHEAIGLAAQRLVEHVMVDLLRLRDDRSAAGGWVVASRKA